MSSSSSLRSTSGLSLPATSFVRRLPLPLALGGGITGVTVIALLANTVTFGARLDRALGAETAAVRRIGTAPGEFPQVHDPGHPAADEKGYVKRPNVDSLVEVMDMREAQRSYSANLSVLEVTRGMLTRTIEALR